MSLISMLPSAALVAAGIALTVLGLLRRSRAPGRHCPKCAYDMTGIGLRCPECGHAAAVEDELRRPRRRRRWRWVIVGGLMIVAGPAWRFVYPRLDYIVCMCLPRWKVEDSREINGYTARVLYNRRYRYDSDYSLRRVEVLDADGPVFEVEDSYCTIEVDRDVTGDGRADLVITADGGGTGCYERTLVFDVAYGFHQLAEVVCAELKDVDGDAIPEIVVSDNTFAYRWTCGACSPYPKVILTYGAGGYHFAPELMRRAAPSLDGLEQTIHELAQVPDSCQGVHESLLRIMLDLIYSGQEPTAWALLARPGLQSPYLPDKPQFEAELRQALSESPYADEIRSLNIAAPPLSRR